MTTKQLRADLVKTVETIRSTQDTLKTLRAKHTSLKAQLTEARASRQAGDNSPASRPGEEG